jgi:hypothetical protein
MKLAAIAALVFASLLIALAPAVGTLYGEVYPRDSAKKEALRQCHKIDPAFNRLIAAARAACYDNHRNAEPSRRSAPLPGATTNRAVRMA